MNAAAPGRCSQLSTISSRCLAARKRSTACSADSPASGMIASALDDRRGNVLRSLHGGERHEVRAIGEVGLDGARGLEREPGLADPAGPGERQQPHGLGSQSLGDRADLAPATDRPVRRRRQRAADAAMPPTARRHRLVAAAPASSSRGTAGAAVERRVLAQDRRVQALQLSAGLDAGVLDEDPAGVAVDLKRLGSGVRCDTARASAAP